jgi:hypothetical protein
VIDPATWKVVKKSTFEVPGVRPELLQPVGMNFAKDGKLLFVAFGPVFDYTPPPRSGMRVSGR